MMRSLVVLIAVLLCASISRSDGAKILALFAFPGKSHSNMLNPVLKELLAKGHELTVVTNFPLAENTPNYTHVDISPAFNVWSYVIKEMNISSAFEMHSMSPAKQMETLSVMTATATEHVLRHPNVQKLMHNSADQHFDLVLAEQFFQDAFLMFATQFRAPVVAIASFEYMQIFDEMFGVFGAWSHVPHEWLALDDHMTFVERVQNVAVSLFSGYNRKYQYMPQEQALADKYFAHLPEPRPTLEQLNRNISLLLLNRHAPLTAVRPSVPALVDVGGLHIADVKPLPADIQTFLDGAKDGVIFFSLGTQLRSADLPAAQLEAFVRTFRRLSHLRIVWKWEDETLANRLPSNVLVKKWMPQNDILAHPNVRLFITHGGLLGTQEGVWHAVPMLGLPVYGDQQLNVAKAQMAGYAISLQFDNVTEASLDWAFGELLENPRYAAEVKRVSRIFRDRPEKALDKAVYWIEYVIRHEGARHLRSAGLDQSWFSYFLLDIVAAGVAIVGVIILFVWLVVRKLFGLLLDNKNVQTKSAKGKKRN